MKDMNDLLEYILKIRQLKSELLQIRLTSYSGKDTEVVCDTIIDKFNGFLDDYIETICTICEELNIMKELHVGGYNCIKLSSLQNWVASVDAGLFYLEVDDMEKSNEYLDSDIIKCNFIDVYSTHTDLYNNFGVSGYYDSTNTYYTNWLYIHIEGINTVEELKEYLDDRNIIVIYKATPMAGI